MKPDRLVRGETTSCGCFQIEHARQFFTTHGGRGKPEYDIWQGMLNRCRNPKVISYKYYGARGIKVCERWNDFANFYSDMGQRPSETHSVDRIDPNGDYEPGNCRWATPQEQRVNQRPRKESNGESTGPA
ncbi:MAG TPA: hypothetical protein VGR43_04090 [Dehalococcoidia bacterium]|nr:hypothetical protein [Dehalococcoidia bacterium]